MERLGEEDVRRATSIKQVAGASRRCLPRSSPPLFCS